MMDEPRRTRPSRQTAGFLCVAALAATIASDAAIASTPEKRAEPPASFQLADGSPSIEDLAGRLLAALEKRDEQALTRLRVNKAEYLGFIMPGAVAEGQPPQIFPEQESDFFWGLLNTRSVAAGRDLLHVFGGHKYALKRIEYRKGHRTYAWYQAYGDPVLFLENEAGAEGKLLIGSIAEVKGRYKFIAFNSD